MKRKPRSETIETYRTGSGQKKENNRCPISYWHRLINICLGRGEGKINPNSMKKIQLNFESKNIHLKI